MHRVIIVHGEKQLSDGSIHPEYIDRLQRAYLHLTPQSVLVLTGGKTRAGFLSEAAQAREWFVEHYPGCRCTVLTEERSKTTAENILCAQDVLHAEGIQPHEVLALVRESARAKTAYLYRHLWKVGAPSILIESGKDTKSFAYRLAARSILYLAAIIDPYGRWLLKIPRKLFRNS